MPQDPKQSAGERLKAKRAELESPQQQQEPVKPRIREGIADNPVDDVINMTKEVKDFFVQMGQSVADWVGDPASQMRALRYLARPDVAREAGSMMIDAVTEGWKNEKGEFDPVQAITQRPFHSVSDLMVLKSMVSKASKVAGLGKVAKAVESFPGKQLAAGGKAVMGIKPVKEALEAFGIGEHTKMLNAIWANESGAESIASVENANKLMKLGLTPADDMALKRALFHGAPEDVARLSPAALKAYKVWDAVGGEQEAHLLSREKLSPSRAMHAKAQQAAMFMPGGASRANVNAAVGLIRAGKINPKFVSISAARGMDDVWEMMGGGPKMLGHWGRLEGRKGMPAISELADSSSMLVKQVKGFHAYRARERFVDRAVEALGRQGKVHRMKGMGDLPAGYAPMPYELYKKYFQASAKAAGIAVRERMKGLSPQQAAATAFSEIIADKALRTGFNDSMHIAIPRDAAAYIAREMQLPGPLWRLYDKGMGYWKAVATIFRPSYWLGIAGGNGIMAGVHGIGPGNLARGWRLKAKLPPELRARLQHEFAGPTTSRYERVAQTFGEYAGAFDSNMLRNPAFAKQVEATRRELLAAGKTFFVESNIINDPQKWAELMAVSPEALSEATRSLQTLYEDVGRSIPRLAAKEREYGQLVRSVDDLEKTLISQPSFREGGEAFDSYMAARGRVVELENAIKADRAAVVDRMTRTWQIERRLPQLERLAAWSDDAVRAGNSIAGSYIRLHPIERTWFRRAIPFYSYTKAMAKFAATLPFTHPNQLFLWNRHAQLINSMRSDPEFPEWLKDYVAVGHTADGSTVYIRLAGIIPWAGATRQGAVGGATLPEAFMPWVQNPAIKVSMELIGGAPSWSKRPWSPGEAMTRLDNGEVFKFENGKFNKVIAQPSVMRSLWYSFPLAQLIEEAFIPYVQTDKGWIGAPDPIRGPDGKIMIPRDAIFSFTNGFSMSREPATYANIALKTVKAQDEDLKRRERIRKIKIIKSYADDVRRAPPEQREAMISILKDMAESVRR